MDYALRIIKHRVYWDQFVSNSFGRCFEWRRTEFVKSIESAIARVAFSVNQIKIEGLFAKHCWSLSFFFKYSILHFFRMCISIPMSVELVDCCSGSLKDCSTQCRFRGGTNCFGLKK